MKKVIFILLPLLTCTTQVQAKVHMPDSVMHRDGLYVDNLKIYSDSALFQGAILKLDLFNSIYYPAISKGAMQSYEMALSFRIKQRFYPTLELGYAKGYSDKNNTPWQGQGGWTTVGLDINGMRKHVEELSALLVGIRVGTALQHYNQTNINNDWWGEIVAGVNVHVYSGLIMGWNARLKLLITRKVSEGEPYPDFVPGFGYRNNTQWGINYYIGWKF